MDGIYAAENLLPDLEIRQRIDYTDVEYFVECKYRSSWETDPAQGVCSISHSPSFPTDQLHHLPGFANKHIHITIGGHKPTWRTSPHNLFTPARMSLGC
ncbi:MAG: hypothetical protein ACI30R_06925 [Sodaliphilus sp.]